MILKPNLQRQRNNWNKWQEKDKINSKKTNEEVTKLKDKWETSKGYKKVTK